MVMAKVASSRRLEKDEGGDGWMGRWVDEIELAHSSTHPLTSHPLIHSKTSGDDGHDDPDRHDGDDHVSDHDGDAGLGRSPGLDSLRSLAQTVEPQFDCLPNLLPCVKTQNYR
jgi:hypothetical protein